MMGKFLNCHLDVMVVYGWDDSEWSPNGYYRYVALGLSHVSGLWHCVCFRPRRPKTCSRIHNGQWITLSIRLSDIILVHVPQKPMIVHLIAIEIIVIISLSRERSLLSHGSHGIGVLGRLDNSESSQWDKRQPVLIDGSIPISLCFTIP